MDVKWIILPTFFLACAAIGCGKACFNNDECGEGLCCIALSTQSRRGSCRKMSRESESCSMPGGIFKEHGEKYIIRCPCREGLTCTTPGKGGRELVYGPMAVMQLRCRKGSSTDEKPVEKPVPGEDGMEMIYGEMDGGKITEEEVINKAMKDFKKTK